MANENQQPTVPSFWTFIEQFYHKYSSCSEITYSDNLAKILGEEELGEEELQILHGQFGGDLKLVEAAQVEAEREIFRRAIEGFLEQHPTFIQELNSPKPFAPKEISTKIVITVEGGTVQNISSTDDVETVVLDWDIINGEDERVLNVYGQDSLFRHGEAFTLLNTDNPTKKEAQVIDFLISKKF